MIKVSIGNNLKRENIVVDEATTTLRKALEDNGIAYTGSVMYLDTVPLTDSELDKTFADCGITESCYLLGVVKRDNA